MRPYHRLTALMAHEVHPAMSSDADRFPPFPGLVGAAHFSFTYDGDPSSELLRSWQREETADRLDGDRTRTITTWTDPGTGLRVVHEAICFADYPAVEWLLHFENAGKRSTKIIADILTLDLTVKAPLPGAHEPYRVHHTVGAPSNLTDYTATAILLNRWSDPVRMSGGGGRSSNTDLPFYKIETGVGSFVVAVGWSGQWASEVRYVPEKSLHVAAGMERTHFRLHPGERVRQPRILLLFQGGDTRESNALFRQLIYQHYAAKRGGNPPGPVFFCNTCFTRGGGWLNECNAENQISLIKAFEPLGVEAVITDAGWFEGGWPDGAGNWTARKDAYPDGMGPVARAANERSMGYGLWFEPERVVEGTGVQENHPDWLLSSTQAPRWSAKKTYLLNFGLTEVQDYFFSIVAEFMKLPGFRVYRQDCNIDPLPYWRENDAEDRQGITEIRYIEGLYAYWDRIRTAWPDTLMEECASGGRRIDLETVMRMHIHQKTDYWFDDEVDQQSLWGLGQYLPNNVFVAHLKDLDEYSFRSTMASSLCIGWIADAPDFDTRRAAVLAAQYRSVRHLLTGAWYPLAPQPHGPADWAASQFHRPDLDEGMVIVLRRGGSPYTTAEFGLCGVDAGRTYEVTYVTAGKTKRTSGKHLVNGFRVALRERRSSELIRYRLVK